MKTPEEFEIIMKNISEKYSDDPEMGHAGMDQEMCELLVSLGYKNGIQIFNEFDKYYA